MIIRSILLSCLFAAALSVYGASAADPGSTSTASSQSKQPSRDKAGVTVYYFHGGVRCSNCINFEKYTEELMSTVFANAVKTGDLEWRVVNTDEPGNEHYMKDFQLYTKSIVVVDSRGKKPMYKNLSGIWQTIGSKSKFQDYVKREVAAVLEQP